MFGGTVLRFDVFVRGGDDQTGIAKWILELSTACRGSVFCHECHVCRRTSGCLADALVTLVRL